jgi:hypothetical protein
MNLKEFFEKFPTEQSCKEHFKLYRDKEGVTCKKCGNTTHYWLSTIQQYKCKKCHFRTTLRSGTIMEHSHLPFQYWYIAMCLVTTTKKTFSALEIQKQIGHKFYEPIWDMMHKIRRAMGERDATYKLQDEVEVDDGFFEVVKTKEEKAEEVKLLVTPKKKRGKGSVKQQAVLVMVESRETGNQNKHQPNKAVSHIKMVTLDGLTASDIDFVSKKAIDSNAVITSNNATYYTNFSTNFNTL